MTQRKFDLSGVDVEEISFVHSGDDPTAKLVMMKYAGDTTGGHTCSEDHSKLKKGQRCESCGYEILKTHPTGRTLYVDQPMEPHKKRKRRRTLNAAYDVMKSPHDGDGDGFYSPARGMPDRTPMPPRTGIPRARKRGDEGIDESIERAQRLSAERRLQRDRRASRVR